MRFNHRYGRTGCWGFRNRISWPSTHHFRWKNNYNAVVTYFRRYDSSGRKIILAKSKMSHIRNVGASARIMRIPNRTSHTSGKKCNLTNWQWRFVLWCQFRLRKIFAKPESTLFRYESTSSNKKRFSNRKRRISGTTSLPVAKFKMHFHIVRDVFPHGVTSGCKLRF